MDVSVVVPVFNEEDNVAALVRRLHEVMSAQPRSYELLLVDDGSSDRTWARLAEFAGTVPHLRLIRFRRNFGQTSAMSAGFDHARGDAIVTLDADLQNDPADIPRVLDALTPEIDVVSGWRKDRKDAFLNRRLPSILANALISKITGVALHDYGCTLKAYRREVIRNVRLYGEMHRFIPALVNWVGGNVTEVVVGHHPRRFGKSKYGLSRTFRVVLDLITVKFLLRYSQGPMQMFGKLAAFFAVPGVLLLLFMTGANLVYNFTHVEFAAAEMIKRPFWLTMSFVMIFMGMQFLSIGLLSEVQTRIYHESQSKPTYVVREILDSDGPVPSA